MSASLGQWTRAGAVGVRAWRWGRRERISAWLFAQMVGSMPVGAGAGEMVDVDVVEQGMAGAQEVEASGVKCGGVS
jgi:hypothetical protein